MSNSDNMNSCVSEPLASTTENISSTENVSATENTSTTENSSTKENTSTTENPSIIENLNATENLGASENLSTTENPSATENTSTENTTIDDVHSVIEKETIENNGKDDIDPFAYLDRDFSSEKFKIEIKRLPKYYGINEIRKLLNEKLKLASNKIKAPFRNSSYIFVCFRSEEDRINAIKTINDFKWKGKKLLAVKAKPTPDPYLNKKRKEVSGEDSDSKRIKCEALPIKDQIRNSSTPYADLPYEEQLEKKQEDMKKLLLKLGNDLVSNNKRLQPWVEKQQGLFDGLPCEFDKIRPANQIDGYRNKCEFTVGINEESKLRTVGFRCGKYMDGSTGVAPVDDLRHIPDVMKAACRVFEEYVRSSDLEVFNPIDQSGHFKLLTVRCTTENQLMLIVGVNPQDLSKAKLEELKKNLVDYFLEANGKSLNVTSLYFQVLKKKSANETLLPELLSGDRYIYETILGLKFRISPQAFFQVNTKGAEVLYETALELASPTKDSTVVDICCGTGTIGLCFAKSCKQVLGVEIVPEAVKDAQENAKDNSISNCEFFAEKAENVLSSIFYRAEGDDIIAIVDPPRAGLHQKALSQLRNTRKLKKLIYISCNPNSAYKNFIDLGRPASKTMCGEPLVPIKAVAVDMFPHTPHCELVIFFQRYEA